MSAGNAGRRGVRKGGTRGQRGMEAFFSLRNIGDERNWTNRTEYRHLFEYLKKLINSVYCRMSERVSVTLNWNRHVIRLASQQKNCTLRAFDVGDMLNLESLNYLFGGNSFFLHFFLFYSDKPINVNYLPRIHEKFSQIYQNSSILNAWSQNCPRCLSCTWLRWVHHS